MILISILAGILASAILLLGAIDLVTRIPSTGARASRREGIAGDRALGVSRARWIGARDVTV